MNLPPPRDFSAEPVAVDALLALRLLVMWDERLTRSFRATEFGITRPMDTVQVKRIWDRVRDRVLGVPHQMNWVMFMKEAPIVFAVLRGYEIMDQARIERSAKDGHMLPLLAKDCLVVFGCFRKSWFRLLEMLI